MVSSLITVTLTLNFGHKRISRLHGCQSLLESVITVMLLSWNVWLLITAYKMAVSSAVNTDAVLCIFLDSPSGGLILTTAKAVPSEVFDPSVYNRASL